MQEVSKISYIYIVGNLFLSWSEYYKRFNVVCSFISSRLVWMLLWFVDREFLFYEWRAFPYFTARPVTEWVPVDRRINLDPDYVYNYCPHWCYCWRWWLFIFMVIDTIEGVGLEQGLFVQISTERAWMEMPCPRLCTPVKVLLCHLFKQPNGVNFTPYNPLDGFYGFAFIRVIQIKQSSDALIRSERNVCC